MLKPSHLRKEEDIVKDIQDCQNFEGYKEDRLIEEHNTILYINYLESEYKRLLELTKYHLFCEDNLNLIDKDLVNNLYGE